MHHISGNILRDQWIPNFPPHYKTTRRKETFELRTHYDLPVAEVSSVNCVSMLHNNITILKQ